MHLHPYHLVLPQEARMLLILLDVDQHKDDEQRGDGGNQVHACPHGQPYTSRHPDAGRRGEAAHRALHLNDGAGTQKAHAAHHLGGNAPRVAVFQAQVLLRDIDADEHGQRGPHGNERESAQARNLALAAPLEAYGCPQQHAQQQLKHGSGHIHIGAHDVVIYRFYHLLFIS